MKYFSYLIMVTKWEDLYSGFILYVKMTPNEQQFRHVLEILAGGVTCDYAPVQGGVLIILDSPKQESESVDISTFLALRDQGLISKQRTSHNWHPIFRLSFQNPVDFYEITNSGREYIANR
ncbi:MAG TPA: hypothetical protein VJJ52_07570 [Candidatus Nanoarchaeia archaeon]|nr:hypothetical protein [Candidatus Nanoarchaeia archaeon]